MRKADAALFLLVALEGSWKAAALNPVPDSPTKTVTLPVREGLVTVNVDGQDVDLLLDSGYFDLNVLDGHWYERTYGAGACKRRGSGCYFCPEKNPCHFDGREPITRPVFGGNTSMISIHRSGSLILGGHNVTDFEFAISRVVHVNKDSSAFGLFGISLVPQNPRYFGWAANITSVMKALLYCNVIARLSYTLQTDMRQSSSLVSGQLTLGDAIDESQRGKYISPKHIFDPVTNRAITAVWVSSLHLLDEEGRLLTKNERLTRRHPSSYLSLLDTGANIILLPQPNVLQEIVSKLCMKLKAQGYSSEEVNRMWSVENGFIYVKERTVSFLPVLTFRLGDGDNAVGIKIPPKHYCTSSGGNVVRLGVTNSSFALLGAPLFKAYSVHVDHTDHKIALLEN
ncbi:hypothetical protein FOZ62_000014 [Perkinsus olseni]|uniref:Peptidase A1 domain-containing protein n=1 Tax=Perkinsus olseni TaxID=32597 RepID=A0A7J6UHT1_PEROL|nr:hypothetical protein FOZ62_000014 [Perkinsus olseni]